VAEPCRMQRLYLKTVLLEYLSHCLCELTETCLQVKGVHGQNAAGCGWRGGERPMVAVPGLAPAPARAIVCRSTHAAVDEKPSSRLQADRRRRNRSGYVQAEGVRH
jgi:hypothetical protein